MNLNPNLLKRGDLIILICQKTKISLELNTLLTSGPSVNLNLFIVVQQKTNKQRATYTIKFPGICQKNEYNNVKICEKSFSCEIYIWWPIVH